MPYASFSFVVNSLFEVTVMGAMWAVMGGTWTALAWFGGEALGSWLGSFRFPLSYRRSPEKGLVYGKQLIRGRDLSNPILGVLATLLPVGAVLAAFWATQGIAEPFVGYLLTLLILVLVDGKKWRIRLRKRTTRNILQWMFHHGERGEIDALLQEASQQQALPLRRQAVLFLRHWGSPEAVRLLGEIRSDSPAEIQEEIDEALDHIGKLLEPGKVLGIDPLPAFFTKIEQLESELVRHMSEQGAWNQLQDRIRFARAQVDQIVDSQMHLRNSYPHLYCRECRTRASEATRHEWRYVFCRTCLQPLHLEADVESVVGQVGGTVDWEVQGERLTLSLWQENETAVPAEVDRIEILYREGINYDWAISAVVEALKNRFPEEDLRIPVEVAPEVRMSANTEHLLREISA